MKTSLAILSIAFAFAGNTAAFWRMPCRFKPALDVSILSLIAARSQLMPILSPDRVDSDSMPIMTLTAKETCTACSVLQDHSAYWTPTLNFIYSNGTTVGVEQVGGMLAYYLPLLENVVAFQKGFQMIAGNPIVRNFSGPFPDTPLSFWPLDATDDQFFLQQRALGFNCLNSLVAPEPSLYRHVLPSKEYMDEHCTDGLRLELAFPSCGNGSIDSLDHTSHVAYPSLVREGNCPDGYDVHYPFLFFETIYATDAFTGLDGEFVLANGDPVGTGYHGDFMMGWESEEFLQSAIDTCTNPSGEIEDCALFDIQSDSDASQCTFDMPDVLKQDEAVGPRQGLPVDIPIQYGPQEATTYPIAGRSGRPTTTIAPSEPPETFSHRTLTYSPADPESTRTAPFGIVVAKVSPSAGTESVVEAESSPLPTTAPIDEGFVATSYVTNGNTVMEFFITEVSVTVTATEAAPTDAKRKRHLHRHLHGGRR